MNDQEENPVEPGPLQFSTYFADVSRKYQHGLIDLNKLVRNFPLDVQEEVTDEGLTIKQGDNVVKSAFDVCDSTRRINKEFTYQPTGFTKIIYPKNLETVSYSRPSEIIPTGCWCNSCYQVGPNGHEPDCSAPINSSLRLTLIGFIKCYYSLNNATVRKKIRKINNETLKRSIVGFFSEVKELEKDLGGKEVYLTAAKSYAEKDTTLFNTTVELDEDHFPTNIKYSAVQSFKKTAFWPGCVELQYYNEKHNKVSIRIYEDKLAIVSYPWNQDNPETIIDKVLERINDLEGNDDFFEYGGSIIKNANGKFRLYPVRANKGLILDKVYDYFHPTNDVRAPIDVEGVKETHKTSRKVDDKIIESVNTYFVKDDELYKYSVVKEPNRGKLSIKDISKCTRTGDQIKCSDMKVTAQIYNSGIIQLYFSYVDKDSGTPTSISRQLNIIETAFNKVKDLFVYHFKQFDGDYFEDVEAEKESDHIWNTVPGVIPYAAKKNVEVGYQIEKFDKLTDEWSGIYDFVVRVNRDIKPNENYILPGAKPVKRIVEKFDTLNKTIISSGKKKSKKAYNKALPHVILDDGSEAYSLEPYVEGKEKYWVLEGTKKDWQLVDLEDYRVHKRYVDMKSKTPYNNSTQVCQKNRKGVPMKPVPYSFYGRCQGGKNQYIDRMGVKSRLDFKHYPCCVDITSKNSQEVNDKMVSFLLDGMTDEEIQQANIEVDYIHGEKIEDKYSGTLIPGTNDIGNTVTFWNGADWLEGRIIFRKKITGVGPNHSRTDIFVQTDEDVIDNEEIINKMKEYGGDYDEDEVDGQLYIITGKDLHPKHRESRNFKGLRNIVPDEEAQKDLLIDCAKKLNLISTEIDLVKANNKIQSEVLRKLDKITGSKSIHETITGIEPFVTERIKNLAERPYEVAILPEGTMRTMLLIIDNNEQYLIDTSNRVMPVDLDSGEYENTIIDGFTTENRTFYPVDILYKNGTKVRGDYLKGSEGRLHLLQKFTEEINRTSNVRSINVRKPLGTRLETGYIGPTKPEESLIEYVFMSRNKSTSQKEMLFIPQIGTARFMLWKPKMTNQDIVLQVIAPTKVGKTKKVDGWFLGLIGKERTFRFIKIPLVLKQTDPKVKKGDFVKLKINVMTSGDINPRAPYLDIRKTTREEMLPRDETKVKIHTVTKMVDAKVFDDVESWKFPSIQKAYVSGDSSREALVDLDDE